MIELMIASRAAAAAPMMHIVLEYTSNLKVNTYGNGIRIATGKPSNVIFDNTDKPSSWTYNDITIQQWQLENDVYFWFTPRLYLLPEYSKTTIDCAYLAEVVAWEEYPYQSLELCTPVRKKNGYLRSFPNRLPKALTSLNGVVTGAGQLQQSLSSWDTSNITDMSYAFARCDFLEYLDIRNWNTSNVTDMSHMFELSHPGGNLELNWDVRKVEDMSFMFYSTDGSGSPLGGSWNAASCTNMESMFHSCSIDRNFSQFLTPKLTNAAYMFSNSTASNGPGIFSLRLAPGASVRSMFKRFSGQTSGVNLLNTTNAEDMTEMFAGSNIQETIGYLDTSKVTSMLAMFSGATLQNLNCTSWDVSNVVDMSEMFNGVSIPGGVSVRNWNASKVVSMNSMFRYVNIDIDVVGLRTDSVTNMAFMFSDAQNFGGGGLDNFNVQNVADFTNFCSNCYGMQSSLSNWDVRKATDMSGMFYRCTYFYGDISAWKTDSLVNMDDMFNMCYGFSADLSNWNVTSVMSHARYDEYTYNWTDDRKPRFLS